MTLGDNNTGELLDIYAEINDDESEKLVLAQLVCSSTNLIIIFIYWSYLLYASISSRYCFNDKQLTMTKFGDVF